MIQAVFSQAFPTQVGSPAWALHFLHIPKTAGTSVRHWLMDFFQHPDWLPCHVLQDVQKLGIEKVSQYRFLSGHFGWKINDYLERPYPTLTWLRDPVKRLKSSFRFIREKVDYLSELAMGHGEPGWVDFYRLCCDSTIDEVIAHPWFIGYNDNLQTRYLSGVFPNEKKIIVDEAILDRAKRNLDSLYAFGICEWMDLSIDYICYLLKTHHRPLTLKFNQTHQPSQPDTPFNRETEAILECERYDVELYRYARQLFDKRFRELWSMSFPDQASAAIGEIVERYNTEEVRGRVKEVLDSQFQKSATPEIRVSEGALNFSDFVYLDGWNARSKTNRGGIIRWAGPNNRCRVFFPLKPGSSYQIDFTTRYLADFRFMETMACRANGDLVPHKYQRVVSENESDPRQYLVSIHVPGSVIDPAKVFTEVSIEVQGELVELQGGDGARASFATDEFRFHAIP